MFLGNQQRLVIVMLIFAVAGVALPHSAGAQTGADGSSTTSLFLPVLLSGETERPATSDGIHRPIPLETQFIGLDGTLPTEVRNPAGANELSPFGPIRFDPDSAPMAHAYNPFSEPNLKQRSCPTGGCEVVAGQILIKFADGVDGLSRDARTSSVDGALESLGISAIDPVFPFATAPVAGATVQSPDGVRRAVPNLSLWYRATLVDENADIASMIAAAASLPDIAWVEPIYVRRPADEDIRPDIDKNGIAEFSDAGRRFLANPPLHFNDPLYVQQWHLEAANVPAAWQWLSDSGLPPGGARDVVVAVIDTGVDLSHPDLSANLWTNSAEFAGQPGVDDDGNGYIDDLHGVNVVTDSGEPLDDTGHGTHVAGIIAAQANNGSGGVGVAYNTQIMAIKASQYSGVLTSSDIAEAVYYAVEKGADVINMSFGGYVRSLVEEDALATAYTQAVLVASAGNQAMPNSPCAIGISLYPAAYNWVLGIMAAGTNGRLADFSNFDCSAHDTNEYELMAPGVDIYSTLPGGNYAAWDGTSMAAPIASGIAALARTRWPDKSAYTSRFIMGQIASNGVHRANPSHAWLSIDALRSLTEVPRPQVEYLEHWIFDSTSIDPSNDGDGILDAGETFDLAVTIWNRWGKADQVEVTVTPYTAYTSQIDPYIVPITDTVGYGAVGSFAADDNGLTIDVDGRVTGVRSPFRFRIAAETPNDHQVSFVVTITSRNGLDGGDATVYSDQSTFLQRIARGRQLPTIISSDMELSNDYYWIAATNVLIEPGVVVTITEGTQLQIGMPRPISTESRYIQVEGRLAVLGTPEQPVEIFPGGFEQCNWATRHCKRARLVGLGELELSYTRIMHPSVDGADRIDHIFATSFSDYFSNWNLYSKSGEFTNSIVRTIGSRDSYQFSSAIPYRGNLFQNSGLYLISPIATGNVFIGPYDQVRRSLAWNAGGVDSCAANPFTGNAILNDWQLGETQYTFLFEARSPYTRDNVLCLAGNFWGGAASDVVERLALIDYQDDFNKADIVIDPQLTSAPTTAYPFVADVQLSTALAEDVNVVGSEVVTFSVIFNRDMSTTVTPTISFGPASPYTDFRVIGEWQNPRLWSGQHRISPVTGDGYQYIRIVDAVAADDPWLVLGEDKARFRFEVATSGTEAMSLQATGGEGYIDLYWTQNDFDLLSGVNLYRADGYGAYLRINSQIIPANIRNFRDTSVLPGQEYTYKFTAITSDLAESDYSNSAKATPVDTIPPEIRHNPVTSAPFGLPLTLSAELSDNVAIRSAVLYHRRIGEFSYLQRPLVQVADLRYSVTLEGNSVTAPGIEYYLEVSDGVSVARVGRADLPMQILVHDKPSVTAVSPHHGPASGGTSLIIRGANFKTGASVKLGTADCLSTNLVSDSQIDCISPAQFPNTVDVRVTNPDGNSGSLLRGFTYDADRATIALPDTGGNTRDVVTIQVNAAGLQGLAAADISFTYDPGILQFQSASQGNLTRDWYMAANSGTAGQIQLSMAASGAAVDGSGVLANLEFLVLGNPGQNSVLHLASVTLNDGSISVLGIDGSFAVSLVYSVTGTVRFWKSNAGLTDAQVTLAGDRVHVGTTNAQGDFQINGARQGSYTLTPIMEEAVNGISAYDAALVLQHAVGSPLLSGYAAMAADVNQNGVINSMDAYHILRKAVDLIDLPFPNAGSIWTFAPASRHFSSLDGDQSAQDFTAVLLGDVSGNWTNAVQAAETITSDSEVSATQIAGEDLRFEIEIRTDRPVYSLEFTAVFDPQRFKVLEPQLAAATKDWILTSNPNENGRIRVAMAGSTPLKGQTVAVVLAFGALQNDSNLAVALESAKADETPVHLASPGFGLYMPYMSASK